MRFKKASWAAAMSVGFSIVIPFIVSKKLLEYRYPQASEILSKVYGVEATYTSLVDRVQMSWGITTGGYSPEDIGLDRKSFGIDTIEDVISFVHYVKDSAEGNYPTDLFPDFANRGYNWDVSMTLMQEISDQKLSMDVLENAENYNFPIEAIAAKNLVNDSFLQYCLDAAEGIDPDEWNSIFSDKAILSMANLQASGVASSTIKEYFNITDSNNRSVLLEYGLKEYGKPFDYLEIFINKGISANKFEKYLDAMGEMLPIEQILYDTVQYHIQGFLPNQLSEYLSGVILTDDISGRALRERLRYGILEAVEKISSEDFGNYVNAMMEVERDEISQWFAQQFSGFVFYLPQIKDAGITPTMLTEYYQVAKNHYSSFIQNNRDMINLAIGGKTPQYLDNIWGLAEQLNERLDLDTVCFIAQHGPKLEELRQDFIANTPNFVDQ